MNGSCACGIFAIGHCADCSALVCGEHSALYEGRLLCHTDIQRCRQEAAEAARREQEEANRRADQRKIDEVLEKASGGHDAIERWLICRSTNLRLNDQYYRHGFVTEEARRTAIDRLRSLIAEAPDAGMVDARSPDPARWAVEPRVLLDWLRRRQAPDTRLSIGMFRSVEGWHIGRGETSGDYRSSGWSYDVILGSDGRRYHVGRGTRKASKWQASIATIFGSDGDVLQLAHYLGLDRS